MTASISAIIFDCPDPGALGEFYRKATGWEVTSADDDFVYLSGGGPIQLAFQRVADHRAPGWPDPAKQAHLDLKVADVEAAAAELVAAGATRPGFQPGGGDWLVLTDPAGHPFCLSAG
ncbi:VOC family protein [Dactylosporangium sp. AC04546]|uniref:VOC family protein n=1 Tax=Dactylosporangium sp. AC04546 TaxID=2862460 RepID=UPI001EDE70A6|nr:VOC family protein [Dactylosporangium sp. AC04546]WVK78668.1 VOC family protein [Dactylosporangium sp. AC04546]